MSGPNISATHTTAGQQDTSVAFQFTDFPFPPTMPMRTATDGLNYLVTRTSADPSQHGTSGSDSLKTFLPDTLDNTRWIAFRVAQDTLSHSWGANGTVLDTVKVAAQWSEDGVNWHSVAGTPTRKFQTLALAGNATDGAATTSLFATEETADADVAEISCECQPTIYTDNAALIINRTLCMGHGWLRFITQVGAGSGGQFKLMIGHWADTTNQPTHRQ